jgi:hypothetical protein
MGISVKSCTNQQGRTEKWSNASDHLKLKPPATCCPTSKWDFDTVVQPTTKPTTQRYARLARDAAAAVNDELGAAMQEGSRAIEQHGRQAASAAGPVMWRPDEREWQNLLQKLPADADRVGVRDMVLAAVREYDETADRGHDLQLLKKLVRSKSFEKLRQYRRQHSDEDVPSERLRQWMTETVDEIPITVEALAAAFRPSTRREQLLQTLSVAWTGPGKGELSISECGPLADFICAVADCVLTPSITGSGVKAFVRRERTRRALTVVYEVWRVQSEIKVASYVIDAAGRRVGA